MQQYISQSLESFQSVFSRSSTWLLFCAIVIGFMGAGEMIGVTSLCRFWLLDELGYYRFAPFFLDPKRMSMGRCSMLGKIL